jgi:predicted glycosyltransferase
MAASFKPDVMVARVGVTAGPVGKLLGVPTVIYDDMEQARLQAVVGMTFATYICTGLGYGRDFGYRQVRFNGPPVLAYLSPDYFTPDPQRLLRYGIHSNDRLIFIRSVAWGASHDLGRTRGRPDEMRQLIERMSKHGRVLISSEGSLPDELAPWRNPVAVEDIHHLLAFASICLVEGGTMAAESAVLGTPAVCMQSYDFGYLVALEKQYGLIARAGSIKAAAPIAEGLLELPNLRHSWMQKREKLLADSDDVTAFQLRMIERAATEYPVKWK